MDLIGAGENTAIELVRLDESMPLQEPDVHQNEPVPDHWSCFGVLKFQVSAD